MRLEGGSPKSTVRSHAKTIEKLARRYWSAEAAIVRAYFRKARRKKEHCHWLKAQAFKEYSAIKPLLEMLTKLHPYLDRGVDRHTYEEISEKLAEETKHARLVLDLLEELTGRKVSPNDLPWLPGDKKLAKVRARYSTTYAGLLHGGAAIKEKEARRKDEDLERAVITLTEGGGGALYAVCSGLKKRGIERKIASAFKEIHRDELEHKQAGARVLPRLVRTERDLRRALGIVHEVSGQRLRMRNEQFGFPLSEEEMRRLKKRLAFAH